MDVLCGHPEGDTAYWKVTVTNTGDIPLANVTVSDPLVPACDITGVTLAVGASLDTYCSLHDITAVVVNVALAASPVSFHPSLHRARKSWTLLNKGIGGAGCRIATSGSSTDELVPASEAPAVTG